MSGRAAHTARPARLVLLLVALSTLIALLASPALAGGLLGVEVGALKVAVGGDGKGSGSEAALGVSLLSPSPNEGTTLLSVKAGETTVLEAQAPTVETPVTTIATTTSGAETPSSGAGSPGAGTSVTYTTDSNGPTGGAASAATPAAGTADVKASHPAPDRAATRHAARHGARRHASRALAGTSAAPAGGPLAALTPARSSGSRIHPAGHHHASSNPLDAIGRNLPLPLPVPNWSKPIILALVLLAIGLAIRARKATLRASRLEGSRSELLRDLDTMQAALVPALPASIEGLGLSVAYRPAEGPAAGGDFYDVFAVGPGVVAAILGDVAGHGHEALKQAALTRYTLRAYMQAAPEPRVALALAGRAFSDPCCSELATVAVAVYDRERGTLCYSLAGHPPPILLGTSATESPAACSSPPLGWDIPTGRRQRTISLRQGTRVCMFSDGLIEARCGGGEGATELLGRERLRELLEELPLEASATELLARVRSEAEATPDDMAACILTAQCTAEGPAIDLEEIELDRHHLESGHLHSFLLGAGLSEQAAETVLAQARSELTLAETTLVRIDRSLGRVTAEVVAIRAGAGAPAAATSAQRSTALLGA